MGKNKVIFKNTHFSTYYNLNLSEVGLGEVEGANVVKFNSTDIAAYKFDLTANPSGVLVAFYKEDGTYISEEIPQKILKNSKDLKV